MRNGHNERRKRLEDGGVSEKEKISGWYIERACEKIRTRLWCECAARCVFVVCWVEKLEKFVGVARRSSPPPPPHTHTEITLSDKRPPACLPPSPYLDACSSLTAASVLYSRLSVLTPPCTGSGGGPEELIAALDLSKVLSAGLAHAQPRANTRTHAL